MFVDIIPFYIFRRMLFWENILTPKFCPGCRLRGQKHKMKNLKIDFPPRVSQFCPKIRSQIIFPEKMKKTLEIRKCAIKYYFLLNQFTGTFS